MKFQFALVLAIAFCQVRGQELSKLDTVYVSTNKTTTLIFAEDVILYDIGSEDFGAIKSGNLLLVKAATDQAAPTSLLIQYGKDIYHATIAYHGSPKSTFLDFRKRILTSVVNENRAQKKDSLKSLEEEMAFKRLNILMSETKSKYKTLAIQQEKLIVSLSNMMTDDNNVYLKLLFINNSKLDYQIDFVEFIYRDPIENGELKGGYDRKNVYQSASNKIEGVRARDERFLGYAIPRFALGKKGQLQTIIREKNGSRVMELVIPFEKILEAFSITQ